MSCVRVGSCWNCHCWVVVICVRVGGVLVEDSVIVCFWVFGVFVAMCVQHVFFFGFGGADLWPCGRAAGGRCFALKVSL